MFYFTIETHKTPSHYEYYALTLSVRSGGLNIQFHHQLEVEQIVIKFYISASS